MASRVSKAEPSAARNQGVPREAEVGAVLGDELKIEAAKYDSPKARPRAFEDERFLFPESYGRNRLRILVKDPEWLFAYWDVAQATLSALRREVGVRAVAVSPLTLRVVDTSNGQHSSIFLPEGSRSWYVRTDARPRTYRAELGLTFPSGEFRSLAASNTLASPGNAPSLEAAAHKATYAREGARGLAAPAPPAAQPTPKALAAVLPPQPGLHLPPSSSRRSRSAKGGASESFRPRRRR